MPQLLLVTGLAVSLTLLFRAERRDDRKGVYVFKPISTLLVILIAALSFLAEGHRPGYTLGLLGGLLLSLGGDVALMFKEQRSAFTIGLVLFLLAHVAYSIVFTVPNGFHAGDWASGAAIGLVAAGAFAYLRPGLGSMKVPVAAYVLVISFMVNRAVSSFFGDAFTPLQAVLISLGAVLFWLSDLFLAVDRFRVRLRSAPLIVLLLYYSGQTLIALSASLFPAG